VSAPGTWHHGLVAEWWALFNTTGDEIDYYRRFVEALHELDLPRRYRTIVVCGVFGLGSTRAQDEEALRRLHAALQPGGTLLLDIEVPWANARLWRRWTREERAGLPTSMPEWGERRNAPDGSERALRSRTVSVDPLDQSVVLEIEAGKWQDGTLAGEERYELSMRMYFRDELRMLFERTGFADVEVSAAYSGAWPSADDDFLVYRARRG